MPDAVSIASFNIHAGVDGWGRPFDVLGACRALDTDVIVLQENSAIDDHPSIAARAARELGYEVLETTFTTVELTRPSPPRGGEGRWGPRVLWPRVRAIRYRDTDWPPWRRKRPSEHAVRARTATIGLALLVRGGRSIGSIPLPRLVADPTRRSALVCEIIDGARTLRIVGVHFGHLSHGSPLQMLAISRALRGGPPTVVIGDMNAWGPVVGCVLRGLRRTAVAPTWPSWRPRHQIDHVFVSPGVTVVDRAVLPPLGSDHLAIRAVVRLDESELGDASHRPRSRRTPAPQADNPTSAPRPL